MNFPRSLAVTLILVVSGPIAAWGQTPGEKKGDDKICEPIKKLLIGHTEVVRFPAATLWVVADMPSEGVAEVKPGPGTHLTDAAGITFGFDVNSDEFRKDKETIENTRSRFQTGNIKFVFVTGKRPGTITLVALDFQANEVCGTTVSVGRRLDIIKAGSSKTLVCDPECQPPEGLEDTLGKLPKDSIVTLRGGPQ